MTPSPTPTSSAEREQIARIEALEAIAAWHDGEVTSLDGCPASHLEAWTASNNFHIEAADALRFLLPRLRELEGALESLIDVCAYATFNNGVTDSTGTVREAEYWALMALDRARAAITPPTDTSTFRNT